MVNELARKYPFLYESRIRYSFADKMEARFRPGDLINGERTEDFTWDGACFYRELARIAVVEFRLNRHLPEFSKDASDFNRNLFLALAAMVDELVPDPVVGLSFLESPSFRHSFSERMLEKAAKIDHMAHCAESSIWTVANFNDAICDLVVNNIFETGLCRFSNDSEPFAANVSKVLMDLIRPVTGEWGEFKLVDGALVLTANPAIDCSEFTLVDGFADGERESVKPTRRFLWNS